MPYPRKKQPRGVVDTSVLVAGIAAFKNPEPKEPVSSALMLRDWINNDTFLCLVNEDILDEYKAILQRRRVRPNLIGEVINLIRAAADDVSSTPGNGISPDPGDEPFCVCGRWGMQTSL